MALKTAIYGLRSCTVYNQPVFWAEHNTTYRTISQPVAFVVYQLGLSRDIYPSTNKERKKQVCSKQSAGASITLH